MQQFVDNIGLRGVLEVRIYKSGQKIGGFRDANMIMSDAKTALAMLLGGSGGGKTVTRIGFGTSGTGPTPDDTALTGAYIKNLAASTFPAAGRVQFNFSLEPSEANGATIREFGLLCSDGTLFARKTRGGIEKADDISFEGSWTIIF